ncbi:MAG: hypothetical protein K2O34_02070 [Acetatifactor sp.]|nr:hypothetical protein [Acetatifactor sp.]
MTLQDKVGILVRYCGQYQSHGFMMDERNTDVQFNIELPEEKFIRKNIKELKVILLTGEAGDGKCCSRSLAIAFPFVIFSR